MAHEHLIVDADSHFTIDKTTRQIGIFSGDPNIIQYDHNSERLTFELPKIVDGHDMTLCNDVQIHYINIDGKTKTTHADVYDVTDLRISAEDENIVLLSWLVSRAATQYAGTLNFVIKFKCIAADGSVDYSWSTAVYKGLTVSEGMDNGEAVAEDYSDILAAWEARLAQLDMLVDSCEHLSKGVSASQAGALTWDGIIGDKAYVESPVDGEDICFVHISDEVPTILPYAPEAYICMATNVEGGMAFGMPGIAVALGEDGGYVLGDHAFIIPSDNYVFDEVVFPKKGVYVWADNVLADGVDFSLQYVSSLRIAGYSFAEKYPDTIARTEDVIEVFHVTTAAANSAQTANCTYDELLAAYNEGKLILLDVEQDGVKNMVLSRYDATNNQFIWNGYLSNVDGKAQFNGYYYGSAKTNVGPYLMTLAFSDAIPTDDHINELINTALGAIENGTY